MIYRLKTAQWPKVPPWCRWVALRHKRAAVVVGGVVFEIMLCVCFLTARKLKQKQKKKKKKRRKIKHNQCLHTARNSKPLRTETVVLTSSALALNWTLKIQITTDLIFFLPPPSTDGKGERQACRKKKTKQNKKNSAHVYLWRKKKCLHCHL